MTSFAFIAGLIPLIFAHGAGAIGNKTIGSSAMGGMILGTLIGVLVIPGLYYIFGNMADGRKMIKEESEETLSESVVRHSEEQQEVDYEINRVKKLLRKLRRRKDNEKKN
jgi:HAE1 family hydrophobic/amphiphilic exporter-1